MLKQLVLTTMLTTGVATTTTPVFDAQNLRNDAITTDYTLAITQQNSTDQSFNNVQTGGALNNLGIDKETKRNLHGNNIALNVNVTEYRTRVTTTQQQNESEKLYIVNYDWYNGPGSYEYENATRITYVMQIDNYNYNKNTNTTISINVSIEDTAFAQDTQLLKKLSMRRAVYTTTQNDWSRYLDKQVVSFNAQSILEEVRDPNSNYLYNVQNELINFDTEGDTDNFEINLLQGDATTYIIVDYFPLAKAEYEIDIEPPETEPITLRWDYTGQGLRTTGLYITGTNIIPSGAYEVVDIPGLMWQILSMPFAFVSQAFNLTLFPGTPYQVNISNLFLSIIGIFVFVWLVGLFLKMKG